MHENLQGHQVRQLSRLANACFLPVWQLFTKFRILNNPTYIYKNIPGVPIFAILATSIPCSFAFQSCILKWKREARNYKIKLRCLALSLFSLFYTKHIIYNIIIMVRNIEYYSKFLDDCGQSLDAAKKNKPRKFICKHNQNTSSCAYAVTFVNTTHVIWSSF